MGARYNGTHAQHDQRPHEWVRPNVNIMVQWSITTELLQDVIQFRCHITMVKANLNQPQGCSLGESLNLVVANFKLSWNMVKTLSIVFDCNHNYIHPWHDAALTFSSTSRTRRGQNYIEKYSVGLWKCILVTTMTKLHPPPPPQKKKRSM